MLEDSQFQELRQEWRETGEATNWFESEDTFKVDWKAFSAALPKGRDVLKAIELVSGYGPGTIRGQSRKVEYVMWRHMACYILVENLCMGVSAAGRVVNKEHSAVVYAVRKFEERLASGHWKNQYERVMRSL